MAQTVLIVDDSAAMHRHILRGIRAADIATADLAAAGDGGQGGAAAPTDTFDLVLCDIDWPLDGRRPRTDAVPTRNRWQP